MSQSPPIKRDELSADLREFIDSFPTSVEIRKRIARNATENNFLKRLLKLADEAQQARESEVGNEE